VTVLPSNGRVLIVVILLVTCLGLAWLYRPVAQILPSCIIRDLRGETIRLYVADEEVWLELQAMKQQNLHKWVGGGLLRDSGSVLGFRFDPQNLVVADSTAETFQTWLQDISDRLEYWLGLGLAYVWAEVDPLDGATGMMMGWRASEVGHQYDKPSSYWTATATSISSKISGSSSSGVWILGYIEGNGYGDPASAYTYISFPKPAGSYTNVHFGSSDRNEAYLEAFDVAGLKIWLQVEPADADINMLCNLVMDKYKHHSCVIGFGLDCEWYKARTAIDGAVVSSSNIQSWVNNLKTHGANYKFFLKHFDASHLALASIEGLVYICDGQQFSGLNSLVNTFKGWGAKYQTVAFQIGYEADERWWSVYEDPVKTIAQELERIVNCVGVYWVDFTITRLYP